MRALLSSLALLAGCTLAYGDELDKKQCHVQSDCDVHAAQLGTPLICRSNTCQAPYCSSPSDCPRGAACVENQCVAPRDAGAGVPLTCANDADCANGSRCGFDHACYVTWGCLDQAPDWPAPASSFHLRLPIRSITALDNPAAIGGLSVVACDDADPTCTSQRVAGASISASDAILDVPFTGLSRAFSGFVKIDPVGASADPDAATLSTWVHFPDASPLVADVYAQSRLLTVTAAGLRERAAAAGVSANVELGVVALQAYDCGGRTVDGVAVVSADGKTLPFLTLQSESRFDAAPGRTGPDGAGWLLNVPGGEQTLVVRDMGANRTLSDGVQFYVAPHAVNYLHYYPRYSAVRKWMNEARLRGLAP